ncbi:cytochrome-c peroxidase [Rhizobium sp. BT-226]|uniref:cytochrome-c peroxidase n=1 Tax=Rhizobium sp. BT-226 TaxID=2986922 RepID=UPI0021F6BFAE|nr:cytochrome c peroxidase [Rhizobium sp. BT-226]MCW0021349.1 c-type cytochrome [Rhizobium sp. BT-226]
MKLSFMAVATSLLSGGLSTDHRVARQSGPKRAGITCSMRLGPIALLSSITAVMMLASVVNVAGEGATAEPISPVPSPIALDERKILLGRDLFTDSRLSSGNGVACASCHMLEKTLADGLAVSRGLPDHPGLVNTPTLFNVALSAKFNWSGKYLTLEEQADMVVENPRTMGGKWDEILSTLGSDTRVVASFNELYPDGITRKNVIDAIVQFEKSLLTPNAPFDRYLKGDDKAISPQAAAGYSLFKSYGCASCHQGVNVGGNMLQVFGIFGTPDGAALGEETPGSATNSGIAHEKPVFRVPPLRNVEKTAPYFHDGSARTLKDAINVMAGYQLGRQISETDVAKLEAFLNSLTGEYQGAPVGTR